MFVSRDFHDRHVSAPLTNAPGPRLMMNASHNPNRSLVHIFCLSLGGLLVLYSAITVYDLATRESAGAAELAIGVVRIALGLLALGVLFRWDWLAGPLQHQVGLMGAAFEADYD